MIYRIKNWQDFQHYKDRAPPWIKLHNTLLTSEVWVMGNDATRALVVASMLLASRNNANDGTFNGDPEYVKRFAYLNSTPDFKPLIQYDFIELVQDASTVLASCNTEERREEKKREETAPAKAAGFCFKTALTDAGGMPDLVTDWMKVRAKLKATNTKSAFNLFMREVEKAGYTVNQALEVCCSRSWKGFDADWVKGSKPAEQEAPKLDTSLESRRTGLQAQADESYRTRQWLDGERKYRTIITIENGQIVRTKHYEDRGVAA